MLRLKVRGIANHWRYTVVQWMHEIKDILEREYGIELRMEEEDGTSKLPEVYLENKLILIGVPGEEGYLIELIKPVIEEYLSRSIG